MGKTICTVCPRKAAWAAFRFCCWEVCVWMRRLSRAAPPVKAVAVLTCRRLKRSERVLLWRG